MDSETEKKLQEEKATMYQAIGYFFQVIAEKIEKKEPWIIAEISVYKEKD